MTSVCPRCVLTDADAHWVGDVVRQTGVVKCPFCGKAYIARYNPDLGFAQAVDDNAALEFSVDRMIAHLSNGGADEAHRAAGLGSNSHEQPTALTEDLPAGQRMVRTPDGPVPWAK